MYAFNSVFDYLPRAYSRWRDTVRFMYDVIIRAYSRQAEVSDSLSRSLREVSHNALQLHGGQAASSTSKYLGKGDLRTPSGIFGGYSQVKGGISVIIMDWCFVRMQ